MERVTAQQVLHHLIDSNFLVVNNKDDGSICSRESDNTYRAVRRYLNTNGSCRGRRKEGFSVHYEQIVWRNRYLRICERTSKSR